jgi:hypothetical protein
VTTFDWSSVPCDEWPKSRDKDGYGIAHVEGRSRRAHRVAWEREHGPIPDGLLCLHHCDNPPCTEVRHLWLGTPSDNMRDKSAKGRTVNQHGSQTKDTCVRGHDRATYATTRPNGTRYCRRCEADRVARSTAARKEQTA